MIFGYYFVDNVGGATIRTNFNYKYLRTICVQNLRILLSSFEKEDFSKICIKFAMFRLSLAIIWLII